MARMHQTTVRFGSDLWADLEREAAMVGVSVAQFVRDAAAARVHHAIGLRGEERLARSLERVEMERRSGEPTAAHQRADARREEASALMAEGAQVRRKSTELRTEARLRLAEMAALAGMERNDAAERG